MKTAEEMRIHRENLLAKARAYDLRMAKFGFTIKDVTPKGYGPTEPSANSVPINPFEGHKTTEQVALENSINEGKTLLKGKVSPSKRAWVEMTVRQAEERLGKL